MIKQKVSSQPENLDQIIDLNVGFVCTDAIYWYLFQLTDFNCSSSLELSWLDRVATGM